MVFVSQLVKLVKKHLIQEFYDQGVECMCIKKFLPLCAALLYPYINIKLHVDSMISENILSPIIDSIKKFTKNVKGLECYSLEGLRGYFEHKWLNTIDFNTQKGMVKIVSLIDNVEDDGFFSLKGNEKLYESFLRIPVLDVSEKYGNLSFEIPKEDVNIGDDVSAIDDNYNISADSQNEEESILLYSLREFLWTNLPFGLNMNRFFWEYKLSKDQYDVLKDILNNLNLGSNTRLLGMEIAGYGTVARVVALFVSEWYKRECSSLKGDRCLETIRLNSGDSESVWRKALLPESFLHKEDVTQREMRQIALCALGGLPLKVVNSSTRFKNLVNGLFDIYQKGEAADEDIENVVNSFDDNNGVFKRSLISGSCKKYLVQMVKYLESGKNSDLPFNESDLELLPFSEFIEKLQEGFDGALRDFFKIDWNFYMESSRPDCDCIINLKIGPKNNRCNIPEKILKKSNVPDVEKWKDFFLYIDYNNGDKFSKLLRFSRMAGKGSPFVGWGNSNVISIPVVPKDGDTIAINIVGINDIDKTTPYTLREFSVNGHFQLFKTSHPYEWSSLTDNKAHSVLLFNPSHYSLIYSEDSAEEINIGSSPWRLQHLYDDVQLEDIKTKHIIDIRIRKGILCVEFKKLPNIIQYNKEGEISYSFYHDEQILNESMPLMLGADGISKVVFYPFEKGESPKIYVPEKNRNIIIKFKQNSYKYKQFEEEMPHTGIISLFVSDGNHSVVKKCFYVSNSSFVKRDLGNSRFVFDLNDAEVFQAEDEKLLFNKELNKIVFLEDKDYLPYLDYLTFSVGTKTDYANINVYRARECRELYFEDHRFTEYGNPDRQTKIPFVLREKFRIRTINKDGVKNIYCGHDIWMNPNVNLQHIRDDLNPKHPDENFKIDPNNGIAYYQYLSKETTNAICGHYSVSPGAFYKYKFFQWNMRSNSAPIPVETEYNPDNKELVVKYDKLEDSCIVFQSLREEQPYNYVLPLLPDGYWSSKITRIYNTEAILNCIEVASEHKIYFALFYPLRKMVTTQKDLFAIFEKLCERKSYILKTDDYKNLHRFAHEFCFEWILLSRNGWKKLYKNEKIRKIIEELFRTTPFVRKEKDYIERVIELYFDNLKMDFRRDNKTMAGVVMQCIRGKKGDSQFFNDDDYEIRIDRLKSIYQDTSICYHLYQKLNELQKNT